MKKDLYVCSKPLQYLNVCNIPKRFHLANSRILLLIGRFYEGETFCRGVAQKDFRWDQVVLLKNNFQLYCYLLLHSFDSLIYGYDNGSIIGIIAFIKRFKLYLLEEGIGTYIHGKKKRGFLAKVIDSITGVSENWGQSSFTKGAFVYYPDLYKNFVKCNYPVLSFQYKITDIIEKEMANFMKLSNFNSSFFRGVHDKKILLYATSWNVNEKIIKTMTRLRANYDAVFIKPHPHIKDLSNIDNEFVIIKTNLMIEFIIAIWLKNRNEVTLFHEGSSTELYFCDLIKSHNFSHKTKRLFSDLLAMRCGRA